MGHSQSKQQALTRHCAHIRVKHHNRTYASTHDPPPRVAEAQRSVTPPASLHEVVPPAQLPGTAETASTVSAHHRRRRRADELTARNPNLDFKLPTQHAHTTTVGHLVVRNGSKVECSSQEARDVVWNATDNCVDRDIGEAIQMLCERTLRYGYGGFLVVLHHGASTYHFVSNPPSLAQPQDVRISVRLVDSDGTLV